MEFVEANVIFCTAMQCYMECYMYMYILHLFRHARILMMREIVSKAVSRRSTLWTVQGMCIPTLPTGYPSTNSV